MYYASVWISTIKWKCTAWACLHSIRPSCSPPLHDIAQSGSTYAPDGCVMETVSTRPLKMRPIRVRRWDEIEKTALQQATYGFTVNVRAHTFNCNEDQTIVRAEFL